MSYINLVVYKRTSLFFQNRQNRITKCRIITPGICKRVLEEFQKVSFNFFLINLVIFGLKTDVILVFEIKRKSLNMYLSLEFCSSRKKKGRSSVYDFKSEFVRGYGDVQCIYYCQKCSP